MFDRFSLPDVATVARRTMVGALLLGIVGLVVSLLLSQPWFALGLCLGLSLGIANFRLIIRSVVRVGGRMGANKRRPLAMNTLGRLMALTVVALVILWFVFPLGFGLIAGLAAFQFLLLFNVTRSMLKAGAGGGPGSGAVLMGLFGGGLSGAMAMDDEADDAAAGPEALDGPAGDRGAA